MLMSIILLVGMITAITIIVIIGSCIRLALTSRYPLIQDRTYTAQDYKDRDISIGSYGFMDSPKITF